MPKLFLDIGNTRIKAGILDRDDYQYLGVIPLEDFIVADKLARFLNSITPEAIYISSVASPYTLESIKSTLLLMYGIFAVILTAQETCCGLTTGYENFHQLGDDRWMALQGANALTQQPSIVIDAGTAMTIDAIVDRKHLGGFIVPGLTSLRASLCSDTVNLTMVEDLEPKILNSEASTLLASNTTSAILGGTLYMTASFINSIILELNQQVGTRFKVYVTGGNAPKLIALIDSQVEYIPDLVLLGMKKIVESVKK